MKVLISAYACEPGHGSEPGVGWNVTRQMAKEHEVYVITRANNRAAIEEELRQDPEPHIHFLYFDLPRWARRWKRGKRGINLYYYLWQIGIYQVGRRLQREVGFDLVHHVTFVRYWSPSFLAFLPIPFLWGPVGGGESAPPAFRRDFALHGRLYEAVRDLVRWLGEHDPFVQLTARRSRLALATTSETVTRLERLGCQPIRLFGESGLDGETLKFLEADKSRRGGELRFMSIGRLLHWKGFHLSLRAFAQADLPNADYWIIGDGPERKPLEVEAEHLGIANKVRFLGTLPRTETLHRLLDADVLVHPSLHDSGGWVCLEGMAAGKPIVCLDLGGPAVQVADEAGIRVEAISPDQVIRDLAKAMERLSTDTCLRQRMGEAGRKLVRTNYLWERRGEEYTKFYREVMSSETRACTRKKDGRPIQDSLAQDGAKPLGPL